MSFSDKISWVGGMMGLFTGFSLISGLEILYWLWFKVSSNIEDPSNKNYTYLDIYFDIHFLATYIYLMYIL